MMRYSMKFWIYIAVFMTLVVVIHAVNDPYIGCYHDKRVRAMNGSEKMDYKKLTTAICINKCRKEGFKYAATQYSSQCFCGNSYNKYGKARESDCSDRCIGSVTEFCGGFWKMSVYKTGVADIYIGCYKDRKDRAVKGSQKKNYRKLTTEKCINKCRGEGFTYAATQFASECFCGDSYNRYGRASESDCSKKCNGNSNQFCGGVWRMSVYRTSVKKTSSTVKQNGMFRNTSSIAEANGIYVGCYNDKADRAMTGSEKKDYKKLTTEICIKKCKDEGFKYAATQFSHECFCGNRYDKYGKAKETDCSRKCSGNMKQICGGVWKMSVYRTVMENLKCRDWQGFGIENGVPFRLTSDSCQLYICDDGYYRRCPSDVCAPSSGCIDTRKTHAWELKTLVGFVLSILIFSLLALFIYRYRKRHIIANARRERRQVPRENTNQLSLISPPAVGIVDAPPPYASLKVHQELSEEPPAYESVVNSYNLESLNKNDNI